MAVYKKAEQVEEKWIKHYSSLHQILLVGEGDFSFSACLALSFGSAPNIIATSVNSFDYVIKNYKNGESNLSILENLGALHLHEVDAKTMKSHSDLSMLKFDRIIFNFPHAGFYGKEDNCHLIGMHMKILEGFFQNASCMLRPNGEVHVTHKTSRPYCNWNLEELASHNGLRLVESVPFKKDDYPGYQNKRGSGPECDEQFPLGECCTFKFSSSANAKGTKVKQNMKRPREPAGPPKFVPRKPNSFEFRHPQSEFVSYMSRRPTLNIPLGRSLELLRTPVCASYQGNIIEHGQPYKVLQAPTCAYQQGNYLAHRHPPSDLVTFVTDTPVSDVPYERSQLLQTPTYASQEGNILEHVLPREHLGTLTRANVPQHVPPRKIHQTLSLKRASQQGNIRVHGQPREILQAPIRANQQRNYIASRHPPSDLNLQMRGIPECNGPSHINYINLKCRSILGGYYEEVVKALARPGPNSSHFLEEALQLGYARYVDEDPGGTLSSYEYIMDQFCKFVTSGRQA